MFDCILSGAKHDCNTEKKISAWLIVSGSAPILFGIVFFIPWRLKKNPYEVEESCQLSDIFSTIVGIIGFIFTFALLICGNCMRVLQKTVLMFRFLKWSFLSRLFSFQTFKMFPLYRNTCL